MMEAEARSAAEAAARNSRARLVGLLSQRTGDLAAAEDALSEAFMAALASWPQTGVPASPDAWLLTAAKRRHIDLVRKQATFSSAEVEIGRIIEELADKPSAIDSRLELLFVCTHPAIDEAIRAPLMLQVVLGVKTEAIAACWLTPPSTMAQRLVRAKKKIKEAAIPFEKPEPALWDDRLSCVLDAIYAALTIGGEGLALVDEALFLASLVAKAIPDSAEGLGLFALCLQRKALRPQGPEVTFAPLKDRNPKDWDKGLIDRAEGTLRQAARLGQPGRYQLEAAIGSAHIIGKLEGRETQQAVLTLYEKLLAIAPSVGARCSYAAALLQAGDVAGAEEELQKIENDATSYQPYWVTLATILRHRGDENGAGTAQDRAIALTTDPELQAFLKSIRKDSTKN